MMQSNLIIRDLVFGEDVRLIEKDNILTDYRAIKANSKEAFLINNCIDYKVVDVSERQKNTNVLYGYTVSILEKAKIFKVFNDKYIFVIDSQDEANLHGYAEIHDSLLAIARSDKLLNTYYEFRKNNLLLIDINSYRNGRPRLRTIY